MEGKVDNNNEGETFHTSDLQIQCAGEAPYTEDVPSLAREVFGALVLTTVGRGNIESIDPTEALVR